MRERPPSMSTIWHDSGALQDSPAMLHWGDDIVEAVPQLAIARAQLTSADLERLGRYDATLDQVTDYLRPSARRELRLALEFSFLAHHGQQRRSGEPYITHPVETTAILARTQMDKTTLVSGLLHDTVEDTCVSFGAIERLFGTTVRRIVEGETKVSKLPKMVRSSQIEDAAPREAEEQVENMRSMFIAMADDWRVVVVKLADRLHNMRTLQHMPPEKRVRIARETLEIFAPLAHRLGMWQFKSELADLSFQHLCPDEYTYIDGFIRSKLRSYLHTLDSATAELEERLAADEWLKARVSSMTITGRTKGIHSAWRKMERSGSTIEQLNDLVALRIVLHPTESITDESLEATLCYHALGKVHGCWTPLPRTLKDYISSPKPNGYRSLHTSVLVGTQPLEVQIRTQSMHHVAEYGAAAHWAYKDQSASLPWLQIIRQWQVQVDSAHEFMQLVRQELLGTRVFVFTRNGNILNLARGATLADAASQLGVPLRTHASLVNGATAATSYELQNGDIVSFESDAAPGGAALAAPFSDASVFGPMADGAALQRDELPRGGPSDERDGWERSEAARHMARRDRLRARAAHYLQERRGTGWVPCTRCCPLLGDELCGVVSGAGKAAGGEPGTLHRADAECELMRRQLAVDGGVALERSAESQAQLSEALVSSRPDTGHACTIVVICRDRRGMLLDVSTAVTDGATNIVNVHSEIFTPGAESAFQYMVTVSDVAQLDRLFELIANVPDVTAVRRGSLLELKQNGGLGRQRLGESSEQS